MSMAYREREPLTKTKLGETGQEERVVGAKRRAAALRDETAAYKRTQQYYAFERKLPYLPLEAEPSSTDTAHELHELPLEAEPSSNGPVFETPEAALMTSSSAPASDLKGERAAFPAFDEPVSTALTYAHLTHVVINQRLYVQETLLREVESREQDCLARVVEASTQHEVALATLNELMAYQQENNRECAYLGEQVNEAKYAFLYIMGSIRTELTEYRDTIVYNDRLRRIDGVLLEINKAGHSEAKRKRIQSLIVEYMHFYQPYYDAWTQFKEKEKALKQCKRDQLDIAAKITEASLNEVPAKFKLLRAYEECESIAREKNEAEKIYYELPRAQYETQTALPSIGSSIVKAEQAASMRQPTFIQLDALVADERQRRLNEMRDQTYIQLRYRDTKIAEVLAEREQNAREYEYTIRELSEYLEESQELVNSEIDNYGEKLLYYYQLYEDLRREGATYVYYQYKQIEDLYAQVDKLYASTDVETLQSQHAEQVADLMAYIASKEAEARRFKQQFEDLDRNHKAQTGVLNNTLRDLESIKQQLEEAYKSIAALYASNAALGAENAALEAYNAALYASNAALGSQNALLYGSLTDLYSQIAGFQAQIAQLSAKSTAEQRAAYEEYKHQLEDLQSQLRQANAERYNLQGRYDYLVTEHGKVSEQLTKAMELNAALYVDVESLLDYQRRNDELEARYLELEGRLRSQAETIASYAAYIATLTERQASHDAQIQYIYQEHAAQIQIIQAQHQQHIYSIIQYAYAYINSDSSSLAVDEGMSDLEKDLYERWFALVRNLDYTRRDAEARLYQTIQEYQAQMYALRRETDQTVARLKKENDDDRATLATMHEDEKRYSDAQIEWLSLKLAYEEKAHDSLNAYLTEQAKRNASLEEEIEAQRSLAGELDTLREELRQGRNRIASLYQELAYRVEETSLLQTLIEQQAAQIATHASTESDQVRQLTSYLYDQRTKYDAEMRRIQYEHAAQVGQMQKEHQQQMELLSEANRVLVGEKARLEARLTDLEQQASTFAQTLAVRDTTISTLTAETKTYLARIQELEQPSVAFALGAAALGAAVASRPVARAAEQDADRLVPIDPKVFELQKKNLAELVSQTQKMLGSTSTSAKDVINKVTKAVDEATKALQATGAYKWLSQPTYQGVTTLASLFDKLLSTAKTIRLDAYPVDLVKVLELAQRLDEATRAFNSIKAALDQRIAELTQKLLDCETRSYSANQSLAAKTQEVADKDRELAAKDRELAAKTQEVAAKDREIYAKTQEVADKDREIDAKTQEVAAKTQEVDMVRRALATKEYTLAKAIQGINALDDAIARAQEELQDKESQLALSRQENQRLQERLAYLDANISSMSQGTNQEYLVQGLLQVYGELRESLQREQSTSRAFERALYHLKHTIYDAIAPTLYARLQVPKPEQMDEYSLYRALSQTGIEQLAQIAQLGYDEMFPALLQTALKLESQGMPVADIGAWENVREAFEQPQQHLDACAKCKMIFP